ncbi:metal ABC transporter solute-binding protein [Sporolactobacillus shoreicorticis]|uniref:Metal ABC transporter solute-binding protein n=1 Tax=Sporolactobacillus shoreicorticis TaxID=1923877 RepID=A0ABW5RZT2_9BACL|nr:metal ABC transporter solute-binding protein [Sporolactobacillus shoreicorticis]MCO7127623.1 metal ABC transporter solute-binding protein [Sporolactobacillus shoreicorticis]
MNHLKKIQFLFLSFILLVGILAGCGNRSSSGERSSSDKISIVAAEDFYGEVAEAVGGKHVAVTSIINKPSMDPHDYEPTTGTAKAVSQAKLVVYNGIGYDGWMSKLVKKSDDQTAIRVAEDVMGKKDGDNEHLWYQPETMPKLADYLADKLAKIDSKHADEYKKNAKDYISSIDPVKEKIEELGKNANQGLVDVSEPVFDYTLDALGYKVANNHFEIAVEQETDPSPKDIAAMQKDIKEKRIAFFVSNIQEISPTVKKMMKLADENKVPVVKVTETLPAGKDYKTWMMDQLKQVEDAQNTK